MTTIFFYLSTAVIALALSATITIATRLFALDRYHLKRRAQKSGSRDQFLFSLHAQRYELASFTCVSSVILLSLLSGLVFNRFGFLYGFALLIPLLFVVLFITPLLLPHTYLALLAERLYPFLNRSIQLSRAPLSALTDVIKRVFTSKKTFDSREELIACIGPGLSQHSDITKSEETMLRRALTLSSVLVRDRMTPRRLAKTVAQHDEVGPLLMDELHSSGHSRFPVVDEEGAFIGTLYLRDLVGESTSKQVNQIMQKDVRFIHEEESLDYALKAFLRLRHHLFIVVNRFEEFVGVLSIEDVLEEIIGEDIVDEYDEHDNLRQVALSMAKKEHAQHSKPE